MEMKKFLKKLFRLRNILKAPLILVFIYSFIASIYAAGEGIEGITYSAPIIFGVILVMYFIGAYLGRDVKNN